MTTERYTPVFVRWRDLAAALRPIHLGVQADIDRLHDIWLQGSPSPDSIVRAPKGYDPRRAQRGNVEKRLMLYIPLAEWIVDVSARRGAAFTLRQAVAMLHGDVDMTA